MQYMGGKNRLAKDIAPILQKGIYIITGGLMILLQMVLLPLFFYKYIYSYTNIF